MARTARLSRRFYETFGDENTNELVGLLNEMDATYLAELRQLNAQNFALFDAKVEQRFAESDARMATRFAEQDAKFDTRFKELEPRLAQLGARIDSTAFATEQRLLRWLVALFLAGMGGIAALIFQLR